jgi:hypothetical protein
LGRKLSIDRGKSQPRKVSQKGKHQVSLILTYLVLNSSSLALLKRKLGKAFIKRLKLLDSKKQFASVASSKTVYKPLLKA